MNGRSFWPPAEAAHAALRQAGLEEKHRNVLPICAEYAGEIVRLRPEATDKTNRYVAVSRCGTDDPLCGIGSNAPLREKVCEFVKLLGRGA